MADSVKSAARVLQVIETLTAHPAGLPFMSLLERLGLPRSSAHALLKTMVDAGFLELDGDRRYRLGIRLWEAGQAYTSQFDLAKFARPFLVAARDALDETVQLAILDGRDNVYIAKEDAGQLLALRSHVGGRLPAHATGLGKALLAGLSNEDVLTRLGSAPLPRFTDSTISDVPSLLEELDRIRERGYATDDSEHTPGVSCVAAPVRDRNGTTVAAISVSVPAVRADADRQRSMISVIRREATALSEALGYKEAAIVR